MCGICGLYATAGLGLPPEELAGRMNAAIRHRGPDDEGFAFFETASGRHLACRDTAAVGASGLRPDLCLGHRRLSILDLSPAGHQPMASPDESLWIAYNGEVYNFLELRAELSTAGHRFVSHTDTEVILAAYREWGPACLSRFNGMFAFAIWDTRRRELFAARDRFGIKPFYYYFEGGCLAFASEIKALLEVPGTPRRVRPRLIYDFIAQGLLDHTEETFFEAVQRLPQGHYMVFSPENGRLRIAPWWRPEARPAAGGGHTQQFLEAFTSSVQLRLRSDVRLGSCLSGGLDSSSIVCMVERLLRSGGDQFGAVGERLNTFTSCFDVAAIDERPYVEEVVREVSALKHYVFPRPEEFWEELPRLVYHQDEPFATSSIYAQWCVMRRAREEGVLVLLDGQGGDEVLCGYRKFYAFHLLQLLRQRRLPRFLSELAGCLLRGDSRLFDLRGGNRYVRSVLGLSAGGACAHLLNPRLRAEFQGQGASLMGGRTLAERQIMDLTRWSVPVLLRYEDRNSMAFAVEARLPFLDYRLAELCLGLPDEAKLSGGWTKVVLREALKGILPEMVRLRRTKLGFETPEELWLKGPLAGKMRDLLAGELASAAYLDVATLRSEFEGYLAGRSRLSATDFFRALMLEMWFRVFGVS